MNTPPTSSTGAQGAGDEQLGGDPKMSVSTPQSTPQSTPPVKSSEEYFNSSRLKVIGMITAATVAVGALGGIAGVVFDPDPVGRDHVVQPGGDGGTRLAPQSLGSPGNSAPNGHHAKSPFTSRVPSSDATSSPSSVGSLSPGSGGLTDAPTDDATDLPTEEPTTDGGVEGSGGATITATGVDIYVPPNWTVDFSDENRIFQSDHAGSFSFAFSFADDPATAAGDIITQNLENLLPAENYTQLQTSDVVPLEPFGSVVSLAGIEYQALWADNQGSMSIHGQIYVGVRQDGTVLGILIEHMPGEDFEAAQQEMTPILDNSFNRFAGLG
jgi:hypothetical protein